MSFQQKADSFANNSNQMSGSKQEQPSFEFDNGSGPSVSAKFQKESEVVSESVQYKSSRMSSKYL